MLYGRGRGGGGYEKKCACVCVAYANEILSTVKIGHRAVRNYNKCILSRTAAFQQGLCRGTPRPGTPPPPTQANSLPFFALFLLYFTSEREGNEKKKCTKTFAQHFLLLLLSFFSLYIEESRRGKGEGGMEGKRICYILFWRWFYVSQHSSRSTGVARQAVGPGGAWAAAWAGAGYVCAARD